MTDRGVTSSSDEQDGWLKSSHSNASGSCIEVKLASDIVLVRDSKDQRLGRPMISLTAREWRFFVSLVRESSSSGAAMG